MAFSLTVEDLIQLYRCQRLPYLERQQLRQYWRDPEEDLAAFRQQRHTWQEQVWQDQDFPKGDPLTPGIPRLRQVSLSASFDDLYLHAQADGLIWNGEWYEPLEIRAAKSIKLDYELRLAILARMMGEQQGIAPGRGWVILADGIPRAVSLWRRQGQVSALMARYREGLHETTLPKVTMSRSRCHSCGWQDYCRQHGDALSLLPGLNTPHYQALVAAGITGLADLVALDIPGLQTILPIGFEKALQLWHQAQATLEQRPIWLHPVPFPSQSVALYFDVEADTSGDLACVLGVLVVKPHDEPRFYGFWTPTPGQEATCWYAFVDLVRRYPTAPIYHFSAFEIQTCRRLAKRYGIPGYSLARLLARFIDLEAEVRASVLLPIPSYSLKQLASWLGFRWRTVEINGSTTQGNGLQAVSWYSQWLSTRDPAYIRALLTYNEDDCRATYRLQEWLATESRVFYP